MAVAGNVTFRFAVFDAERNVTATTWSCVIAKGTDVYLFARSIGYALKFSVHTHTGQCHMKYQPPFMKEQSGFLKSPYVTKWAYTLENGWSNPFSIVTPGAALTVPLGDKAMRLIPSAPMELATIVSLIVAAPDCTSRQAMEFSHRLPNGIGIHLLAEHKPLPALKVPPKWPINFYKGAAREDLDEAERLRAMVITGEGASRQAWDCIMQWSTSSRPD